MRDGERVVSVGVSQLLRLVETPTGFRVEQAVQEIACDSSKRWAWRPLAFATEWNEAHGALHQMQDDLWVQMKTRRDPCTSLS